MSTQSNEKSPLLNIDLYNLDTYPDQEGCYLAYARGGMGLIYFHNCNQTPKFNQLDPNEEISSGQLNKKEEKSFFSSYEIPYFSSYEIPYQQRLRWLPIKINLTNKPICKECK